MERRKIQTALIKPERNGTDVGYFIWECSSLSLPYLKHQKNKNKIIEIIKIIIYKNNNDNDNKLFVKHIDESIFLRISKGKTSYLKLSYNPPWNIVWVYVSQVSKLSVFFQGAQLHLQKLHKGVAYRNQYIFGLPAEIWGSPRRIQGSPGLPAPPNFRSLYHVQVM